ncbi:MAG TPA: TlpA disulfide reductase family protein [Acidimicrobiales bacterium]|nr:TlpA disulfide reductase family protein [Acidimicrobiales bacterium]
MDHAMPAPARARRRHVTRWVAGAVLVVLVAVAVVAATRPSSQATEVQSPLVGHRAPALTGTTLGGRPFALASERGHYVYVNFFASWCPPCQQEQPALVDFAFRQSRVASGARMVSVVFNDTVAGARRFVADWGLRWPVVPDSGGAIANRYGVGSPPMTFLVAPSGVVAGTWIGPVTVAQLDQMLVAARRGELFSGGTGTGNG